MYDRKGEPTAVLAAVGLLVLALVFGMMSLPVNTYFSDNLDTSVEDLDRIADTKAYGELYFYNYIPTAGIYSTYQNSYDLAKQGGSPSLDWNSDMYSGAGNNIPFGYYPGTSCSTIQDTISRISCRLGENVTEDVQDLVQASNSGRCERPDYNLDVWFNQNSHSIRGNVFAIDPVRVDCNFPDGKTMYRANNSFLSLSFDVTGNRYLQMAEEANRTLYQLHDNWQSVDTHYTDTVKKCDERDYEAAEENVVSFIDGNVSRGFNNAPQTPSTSQMGFEKFEVVSTYNYHNNNKQSSWFEGTYSQTDLGDVGDCNCHGYHDHDGDNNTEQHCVDDIYKVKVNITVDRSKVDLVVNDTFSKVPVNSGKRYMKFRVEPYTHKFPSD